MSPAPAPGERATLSLDDVSAPILRTLLRHCYNGHAENTVHAENALELLDAAHRFGLVGLKELCTQFLTFHLNKETAVAVLIAADRCAAPELGAQCIQYIVHHLKAVQHCAEFAQLPKHLLGAIKLRAAQKIEQISSQLLGKRTRAAS